MYRVSRFNGSMVIILRDLRIRAGSIIRSWHAHRDQRHSTDVDIWGV
jgi:hypothetical protein